MAIPVPGGGMSEGAARAMMRYDANKKSAALAYVLWFFLGLFGIHRIYLKKTTSGVIMLVIGLLSVPLTYVLIGYVGWLVVGVWAIVDLFLIPGWTRDYNNRLIGELTG